MAWEVEVTDEFLEWYMALPLKEAQAVFRVVGYLEERGPQLSFPFSSDVRGSRHGNMRELRAQSGGHPLRMLYAFDPRRTAIILLGGDKTGDDAWYERNVPLADRLYDEYLEELRKEGLI
ncbi:MAG TPA: type II toxin-antitoxin system RelE/ParE family toxin [Longimicrobium sp.]